MAETTWRDMSVPYKEEEYEGLREIFRTMPSYKDGYILSSDFADIFNRLRYNRTPEQVEAYVVWWDHAQDGKMYIDQYLEILTSVHTTSKFTKLYVEIIDKNKNGYIGAEEFDHLMTLLPHHDQKLIGKTSDDFFAEGSKSYEEFVTEADTNKDGIVDTEECAGWIAKYTQGKYMWVRIRKVALHAENMF